MRKDSVSVFQINYGQKLLKFNVDLPVPNLSGKSRQSISNPNIEESTIKSSRQRINPKSPNSRNFYDIADADPWASSIANQNQHVAYTEVNVKQEEMDKEYSIPFKATQNTTNRPSNNPAEIFAQPKKKVLDHTRNLDSINNNFTSQKSVQQSINENKSGYSSIGKYPLKASSPLGGDQVGSTSTEETILVKLQPEKEGVFMFQHHCYDIISARRGTKAVRRFSDFVWLLDYLQRRYPFRQIPLLPPKRIGVNGNHLAADSSFIEKRRRGLSRFANSLIRHPVLSKDMLVIRFLTQPSVSLRLLVYLIDINQLLINFRNFLYGVSKLAPHFKTNLMENCYLTGSRILSLQIWMTYLQELALVFVSQRKFSFPYVSSFKY